MLTILLFILFGGLAIGCAVSMVAQRNPLYSAVSLIGVFASLACLYVMLAAPFIAAVQIIVYAGAIMVLVVFVIMLLNVEEEEHRPLRLSRLLFIAVLLGAVLFGEAVFMLTLGAAARDVPHTTSGEIGLTTSIGTGLFTEYLLPFEITSVLILMALVGAMTLARQVKALHTGRFTQDATARVGGGESGILQPGRTEATGQAMAQWQIEHGEAAAPAEKGSPRD